MRFLKKLLVGIYIYLGVFAIACLVSWVVIRDEPAALIAAVFATAGIESIIGGIIKRMESNKNKKASDTDEPR